MNILPLQSRNQLSRPFPGADSVLKLIPVLQQHFSALENSLEDDISCVQINSGFSGVPAGAVCPMRNEDSSGI